MIADVAVSSGLIYATLPALIVALISLIAFLFRQNARSNEALSRTAQELKDIARRTDRLEDAVFPTTRSNKT